jgi:hypothetical protein
MQQVTDHIEQLILAETLKNQEYLNLYEGTNEPDIKLMTKEQLEHYQDYLNHYGYSLDMMLDRVNELKAELMNIALNLGDLDLMKKIANIRTQKVKSWQI